MAETPHQTSMNSDEIKNSLEKLGYTLKDFGNHWRTKALYRGGDNPTAIKIYKNSGVWQDYVQGDSSLPLVKLAELTLQTKDPKIIKQYTENGVIIKVIESRTAYGCLGAKLFSDKISLGVDTSV